MYKLTNELVHMLFHKLMNIRLFLYFLRFDMPMKIPIIAVSIKIIIIIPDKAIILYIFLLRNYEFYLLSLYHN